MKDLVKYCSWLPYEKIQFDFLAMQFFVSI